MYDFIVLKLVISIQLIENLTLLLVLGHVIVITGIPYGNPKGWFLFRFTESATKKEGLHFNPRFEPYYVVVRNTMNDKLE